MPACEACWERARFFNREYKDVLREAELEQRECTLDSEAGRKMRAGQFWDAERKVDTRENGMQFYKKS